MNNGAVKFTTEPYISNGRPQWAVVRHVRVTSRGYGIYKPSRSDRIDRVLECIVETKQQAYALMAHMQRPVEHLCDICGWCHGTLQRGVIQWTRFAASLPE